MDLLFVVILLGIAAVLFIGLLMLRRALQGFKQGVRDGKH